MDIVERLKAKPPKGFVTSPLMIEAADEIERLRDDLKHSDEVRESALQSLLSAENEIERLRAALERAADALHDAQALDAWAQTRKELEEKN